MSEVHRNETTGLVLMQDTSVEEKVPIRRKLYTLVKVATSQATSRLIKQPGDSVERHMSPKGDVITRVKTKELNVTHRQYSKKDGTKGKQVLILKQIER